jgi:hypothetical protein
MTEPTPVADDAHASTPQLLARAAQDYATGEARRHARAHEDRISGQHNGSPYAA